jgi:predicted Zn-dependent protease
VTHDGQSNPLDNPFLAAKIAVNDVNDNGLTIEVRTKNGLLKAAQDGENLTGTRVTVAGSIDLASISSHWMNDEGDLIARKKPQFRVYVNMIERHGRKQPAPAAATVQAELAV